MKEILIVLILASMFVACDDDDKPANWTRYEYLNEARDYIYFKTGTWWVYKKIPGGELDTIEVTDSWIDTIKLVGGGNTLYFEHLEWTAKSRMDHYEYEFSRSYPPPYIEGLEADETVWMWYFMTKSKPGSFLGATNVFTYPFTPAVINNGAPHVTKMLDDIDTLEIQGLRYFSVRHFDVSDDQGFIYDDLNRSGGQVQYYWAPRTGIIKKEHMKKNISWELVESHIVQ